MAVAVLLGGKLLHESAKIFWPWIPADATIEWAVIKMLIGTPLHFWVKTHVLICWLCSPTTNLRCYIIECCCCTDIGNQNEKSLSRSFLTGHEDAWRDDIYLFYVVVVSSFLVMAWALLPLLCTLLNNQWKLLYASQWCRGRRFQPPFRKNRSHYSLIALLESCPIVIISKFVEIDVDFDVKT